LADPHEGLRGVRVHLLGGDSSGTGGPYRSLRQMMPAEFRGIVDDRPSQSGRVRFGAASASSPRRRSARVLCIATEPSSIAGAIPWPERPPGSAGAVCEISRPCTSDVAFWLYTSGTTGTPKGGDATRMATSRHRGTARRSRCSVWAPANVILSVSRMHFSYGLGNSVFVPAAVGGHRWIVNTAPANSGCPAGR